ncbi:MAG: hypothetical protein Q7W38_08385, partial [Deltaproteobacteria bacterium]|nr:hypothetical protein [Deltaproteobacteria bacterium]
INIFFYKSIFKWRRFRHKKTPLLCLRGNWGTASAPGFIFSFVFGDFELESAHLLLHSQIINHGYAAQRS